jgi:hypothetical protein
LIEVSIPSIAINHPPPNAKVQPAIIWKKRFTDGSCVVVDEKSNFFYISMFLDPPGLLAGCSNEGRPILNNSPREPYLFFAAIAITVMNPSTGFRLNLHIRLCLIICFSLVATIGSLGQNVYVTKTGDKYHKDGCRYLAKSKISIEFETAVKNGYSACSICKPQARATKIQNVQGQTIPAKSEGSVQCQGMTKKGDRCSRMTKEANGRCFQHQ